MTLAPPLMQRCSRRPAPIRRVSRLGILALACFLLVGGAAQTASAHGRSLSYSTWELTETGARVRVRISLLELSRLSMPLPLRGPASPPSETEPIGRLLAEHVRLVGPAGVCPATAAPSMLADQEGWVQYRWTVACAGSGAGSGSGQRSIETDLLLDVAPSHLHFARLLHKQGGVRERVLVEGAASWPVGTGADGEPLAATSEASGFLDYVSLGIEHILTGWDHLAFVFALVLLAGRAREVVRLVTGFTIAHSLTLALAVLGFVQPVGPAVEAVIGFSVALVAAENAWLMSGRGRAIPIASVAIVIGVGLVGAAAPAALPWLTVGGLALFTACHFGLLGRAEAHAPWRVALAFAFGLVHGFGFAGILAEMALPAERLVPALFGFNVGVELGQLAVVIVVWPLLRIVDRRFAPDVARWVPELASAAICGIGLFWFIRRGLGLE